MKVSLAGEAEQDLVEGALLADRRAGTSSRTRPDPLHRAGVIIGNVRSLPVLFAAALLGACASSLVDGPAADAILIARAEIDRALLHHAFAVVGAHTAVGVNVSGPVWRTAGREKLLSAYEGLAKERPDVHWSHSPREVEVNSAWGVAAERGTWYETWTEQDGQVELRGSYTALWRKMNGKWLLEAEVFVPLRCTGGAYCKPHE